MSTRKRRGRRGIRLKIRKVQYTAEALARKEQAKILKVLENNQSEDGSPLAPAWMWMLKAKEWVLDLAEQPANAVAAVTTRELYSQSSQDIIQP